MDIHNQFDQELLSAYLDDALSGKELADVEIWLAKDDAANRYLTQLRDQRTALKSLAAINHRGLKAGFANEVLALALAAGRDQRSMDEGSMDKVQLPSAANSTVETSTNPRWMVWASLAATAAAVTWLLIVPSFRTTEVPQTLVGNVPLGPPDRTLVEPELPQPELPSSEPTAQPETMSIPRLADTGKHTPDQLHQPSELIQLQLVFIGDVLVEKEAWESAKFDQLLEKYGIRYSKELVANQRLIEGLVESRVIAGGDPDPNAEKDAALVYIDCPASAMNKLVVEIENDHENFADVQVSYALSGAGSLGGSVNYDNLLTALRDLTGTSTGRGVARLIVPEKSSVDLGKMLTTFDSFERKDTEKERADAAKRVANGLQGNLPGNVSAEMLFILRKR